MVDSKPLFFSQRLLPENSEGEPEQYRKRQKRKAKAKSSDRDQELLVFGYEARIFHDNETATKIDNGKYLIAWQGRVEDPTLLDRYDVRNFLDDLHSLTLDRYRTSHDSDVDVAEDIDIVSLDTERYADLDSDEEDLFLMSDEDKRDQYVEEKRKRRKMEQEQSTYQYSYDDTPSTSEPENKEERSQVQEEPAETVHCNFQIPNDMEKPKTQKQMDIIEKTAKFIASSTTPSPQMEITIQAKQASNPMFAFLHKDNSLYKFYRHILWLSNSGLCGYGSSDSEDDRDMATSRESSPNNAEIKESKISPEQTNVDMYEVIEKTAAFVAKAGPLLESKIKEKNLENPKFSFLQPWNEFHTHYRARVDALTSQMSESTASPSQPTPPVPSTPTPEEEKKKLQSERLAMVKALLASKSKSTTQ